MELNWMSVGIFIKDWGNSKAKERNKKYFMFHFTLQDYGHNITGFKSN